MYRLENWSVASHGSPYDPPEVHTQHLQGDIYGREDQFEEGSFIITSRIISVDGNKVTTYSGSIYELGKPSETFVKWCQENGVHIPTEEEPIKMKGAKQP